MIELIEKGGMMMYPIVITSIVAFTIVFEKFYVLFFQGKYLDQETIDRAFNLLDEGKRDEAENIISSDKSPFSDFFLSVFREKEEKEMEHAASISGDKIIFNLSRRLSVLSISASVLPLMGLLGTVLGMIKVFSRVAHAGSAADISILAGGIWESLITTAAGMLIAIPVILIHHYYKRNISDTMHFMQQDGDMLISKLKNPGV